MKIGFDLDGVLLTQNSVDIVLTRENDRAKRLYYETLQPQLTPCMFAHDADELFIITAREQFLQQLTKKQCDKFFPNITLVQIAVPQWENAGKWYEWFVSVAKAKAEVINQLGLDIYFEDMPITVEKLRELCKKCKIIQYGGRI